MKSNVDFLIGMAMGLVLGAVLPVAIFVGGLVGDVTVVGDVPYVYVGEGVVGSGWYEIGSGPVTFSRMVD